jgi:phosphate transport system ATP-binding protein
MEHYLRKVGLWNEISDRLHKPASHLSGGQQQRLVIARALSLNPEIILMDEPCSALDPISTRKIEEIVLELKQQYTFVIVTHNIAQARRISDHVALFWQKNGCGYLHHHDNAHNFFQSPIDELCHSYIHGHQG